MLTLSCDLLRHVITSETT